jgi:amino acid adenylation domain-containing protein
MSSNSTLATAAFKLSSQQERVWLQHENGAPQFAQGVIGFDCEVDVERLKRALQQLVAKYEILRTRFRRQTGIKLPFQVIQEGTQFRFEQITNGEIELLLRRDRESPWELESGPAIRALLATTPSGSRLAITLPALCADSSTLKNLFLELAAGYAGQDADANEVMQYADLVEWQNEMLASDETKPGREFWRDSCRNIDFAALQSITLPLEKPARTFTAEVISSPVPKWLPLVESLASRQNVSPEDIFLAAWQALLLRLTGQSDLTTGCEFNGRRYEELGSALGPLARTLPVKAEVKVGMAFETLVGQVASQANEAGNWQESFAWGQAAGPDEHVLPFSFAYQDLGGKQVFEGIGFTLERAHVVSERYRLRLVAVQRGAELELEFHYDASRFERGAVERIAGYYINLLTAALANPATAVSRLPLLSQAERQQLLVEWNQTAADYPKTECLHELFEQQAAKTPERLAVRSGEQGLSYRELNQRANQLAHYLRQRGVGPDRPVGLCLERSAETMVAVLAILKAGGAYVPLNADNPPARLKQQLEGAAALITEAKLVAQMPEFTGPMVVLDRDQKDWAAEPKSNPTGNTNPENLVYVIYTSGSTGVPKGVAVRHRNLVNYAHFITKRLELDKYPDALQFATVSTLGADLGNTCIYPALVSGGTLHMVSYEMATDPGRFADYVAQYPIDALKIVPSHLQALLQSEEAQKLLPRKYLITGGETLTPKLVEKIASLNPQCEVINHYGPTETTVGSLTLKLKEYDWKKAGLSSIPIGRPIQNTQAYILDQNLEPVPVGVIGELYIAGAGVTAGYLNQAEKTAERFLKNPFVNDAEAKMYRTGDLARYGEDGNIEFLGRGDDQVKVRGFRIELGEIEAVLARHAAVKQVVVLARGGEVEKDAGGDKRLLAYVVPSREASMSSGEIKGEELRAYLKQQLPDYMVPQAVVILPKLPLTANGKIDRNALPEPEQAQVRTYIAPRTATEQKIAEIWAEVLRRDAWQISVDDNFFDLGGHSLLATQVISRVRRALNVELPLRTLFESPTVARLAGEADKASRTGAAEIPPIVKVSRNGRLPLSFAQQRLWVLDRIEPNNPLYNTPRTVRLIGDLNTKALIDALNEIVRRHESQRTTFATGPDGQPVQVIVDSLVLGVPVMDLSSKPHSEVEAREIAAEEARTPFDLAKGPLLRAKILRLDARNHVLLLTLHHIVSDAWSAGIFMQELGEIYSAYLQGKPSPLPEITIQYADYAAWQRNFLQGKTLENQIGYWREHLRGAPPLLQLPADRPRPTVRKFHGAYEPIPLANDVTASIKGFCQQEGVTPFMTLLAAFKALLFRHSGQEHIVLGTDIANRTTAETERLMGFFINLLPLHTDLSGNPTFRELVLRVREVALGAYAHQDLPFDKLVEDLQPERSMSHNPIVQALFVMQNIPRQRRELPGLELAPFSLSITRSKFDVAVFMRESDQEMVQEWLYSTELFERETILRMASQFENLLRHAISQPETRLSALEMFSEQQKIELEKQEDARKQSQRKKLMSVEPRTVRLAEADPKGTP